MEKSNLSTLTKYDKELLALLLAEQKEIELHNITEDFLPKGVRKALSVSSHNCILNDSFGRTGHSKNKRNNARITKKNKISRTKAPWKYIVEEEEEEM